MSALQERPQADHLPESSGAAILQNGHYLPPPANGDGQVWVRTTALVQREATELYNLWRDLERVPQWQEDMVSVVQTTDRVSRWTMRDGSDTIEWNAETMVEEPGKRIVWRSIGGDIEQAGEVIFENAPGNRGTLIIVLVQFKMGKLANLWKSFTERGPRQRTIENLRHFKALAETGEIPNSQTAPHGDRGFVGGIKRSMYGEKIPTPAGESASNATGSAR